LTRAREEMGPADNKIAGWLYQGAGRDPDRVLVHSIEQEKSITWGEMASISRRSNTAHSGGVVRWVALMVLRDCSVIFLWPFKS